VRLPLKKEIALSIAILICLAGASCSRNRKPDFREVRWGMTKSEVKKVEKAELMKEGNDVLTYRLGGNTRPLLVEGGVHVKVEGAPDARDTVNVEKEEPAYDLVYVFTRGKLSMAVVHLRGSLDTPKDYMDAFKEKSKEISKEIGEHPAGVAEYPGNTEPKEDPYSSPEDICEGKYVLKHVWPPVNERTEVSLELDHKKPSAVSDCNLAVFYESVKYKVDPKLEQQLHDVL
jgi:hypothetical protein